MTNKPFLIFGALLLMLAVAVGLSRSGAASHGLGTYPEIVSFNADRASVPAGGEATLSWTARAASVYVEATPENGQRDATVLVPNLPAKGSLMVKPNGTTKYVLHCVTPFAGLGCVPTEVVVKAPNVPAGAPLSL